MNIVKFISIFQSMASKWKGSEDNFTNEIIDQKELSRKQISRCQVNSRPGSKGRYKEKVCNDFNIPLKSFPTN
jgi:hypothetical protein